ncbi:hypothetical protein ScalyP_jg6557 [Parmales sp. scaly parma]|nr:hypothetical protein ScalyP_jg6557 [Parmales sp. scaly parma]
MKNRRGCLVEDHTLGGGGLESTPKIKQKKKIFSTSAIVHDCFNVIFLLPVLYTNFLCWESNLSAAMVFNCLVGRYVPLKNAFDSGEPYNLFICIVMVYFIIDTMFVLVKPNCVASPRFIVGHHFVSICGVVTALYNPYIGWSVAMCMSVEVSTWFLITRRAVKGVFGKSAPKFVHTFFAVMHYFWWFFMRMGIQNGLLVAFVRQWYDDCVVRGEEGGGGSLLWVVINPPLVGIPVQGALVAMNIKWTVDLVKGVQKRGWNPDGEKKGL